MRTTAPPFVELSDPIRREILRRQERYPVEALEELQPTDYKLIQPFPTADVYHVATLIGGRWQTCFCHYCQSTLFYQGDDGLLHCADPDCRSARIDVTEEWPI